MILAGITPDAADRVVKRKVSRADRRSRCRRPARASSETRSKSPQNLTRVSRLILAVSPPHSATP